MSPFCVGDRVRNLLETTVEFERGGVPVGDEGTIIEITDEGTFVIEFYSDGGFPRVREAHEIELC